MSEKVQVSIYRIKRYWAYVLATVVAIVTPFIQIKWESNISIII